MSKQWAPPIGSLPKPADGSSSDAATTDYHVLTVDDTIRRYNGFVASYVRPPHPIVVIDGGIEQELVTRAITEQIGRERQYAIVPTLIEPDTQPPLPATVIETAVAIQLAMQLTGRHEARRRFVGSHPVSLRRCDLQVSPEASSSVGDGLAPRRLTKALQTLTQHNYMVSQKWDGERKMLLLHSGRM